MCVCVFLCVILNKLILKCTWKGQGESRQVWRRRGNKTVVYWHRRQTYRWVDQNKSPEITCTHKGILYLRLRCCHNISREERETWVLLTPATKIKDLNAKSKCLQLLEETIGKYILLSLSKGRFLLIRHKHTNNKIREIYLITVRQKKTLMHTHTHTQKDTINKIERNYGMAESIYNAYTKKGKYFKEEKLYKLNSLNSG